MPNIVDIDTFSEVHLRTDDRIKDYLEYPRRNYGESASSDARFTLARSYAYALYANNAHSRIGFAAVALRHVAGHWGIGHGPRCFVTVTPVQYAFALDDRHARGREARSFYRCQSEAANFDIRKLQGMVRQAFGDLPFIGMVEVALFPRWSADGWARFDYVSWHSHLLVWGISEEELNRVLRPLRDRLRSIKVGVTAVHVQEVPDDDIARQLIYAMKSPQKVYRTAFLRLASREQKLTGFDTRAWRIKKDWLRTGQRVRLLDVMGERTLDQLLFGNREGTDLANAIRLEALKPFRAQEAQEARRRERWLGLR